MELPGQGRIHPPGWLMILHSLEGQHEPTGAERRAAAAE
jgi:hypothetical protein